MPSTDTQLPRPHDALVQWRSKWMMRVSAQRSVATVGKGSSAVIPTRHHRARKCLARNPSVSAQLSITSVKVPESNSYAPAKARSRTIHGDHSGTNSEPALSGTTSKRRPSRWRSIDLVELPSALSQLVSLGEISVVYKKRATQPMNQRKRRAGRTTAGTRSRRQPAG
jgi:hypothetical protein